VNQKRIILVTALLIAVALVAAVAVGYAAIPQARGQIELSATEFDFGTIPNTGPVSQVFQIRNAGDGPLKIGGVSTSCGCTTAQVGSQQLAAGESTDLTVTYDPLTHNGAAGDFMRLVYIRSDDPDTPEANLSIRVTVVEP
jgi:hypothetical protein